MSRRPMPSQELLRNLFDYDADTGNLIYRQRGVDEFFNEWRWKIWNAKFPGKIAGTINTVVGYRYIKVEYVLYSAHRLVWMWHYGEVPDILDHKDCDKLNNRIENLRLATFSENLWNSKVRRDNSSGYKGVSWHSQSQKWRAQIQVHGQTKHLGSFENIEDARECFASGAAKYHGEFARVG